MTDTIRYQFGGIAAAVDDIRGTSGRIQGLLEELKAGIRPMTATWQGDSAAAYEEAQAAIDGKPSAKAAPLVDSALKPLWAAYAALSAARDRREPLNLDLPERRVKLDDTGHIERIYVPERLEAHRLIEEFMILANVAAREVIVVQSTVMLIIVFTVAVNLLVDLLYGLLDPRVRTAR